MLSAPTLAQIESIVHSRIRTLLAERAGDVGHISGADKLSATLGLSSLDLAFLVAELEAEFGVDPFVKLVSITSVRSVEDLVRAYQQVDPANIRTTRRNTRLLAYDLSSQAPNLVEIGRAHV